MDCLFAIEKATEKKEMLEGLLPQNLWNDINMSLPQKDLTEYLVYTNYGTIEVSTFYDGKFIQPFSKVEYWMDLPLPPKYN